MRWMRLGLLCTLLAGAATAQARAATIDGVGLPDTYPAGGQTLVLNGIGIRTLTIFQVRGYVAGLYLAKKSQDAAAILASPGPKVVLLQFLHSATKAQIEHQYREGEQKNCGHNECSPADQAEFEKLVAATPAMAVGDTMAYVLLPGSMRLVVNNRVLGEFANKDLAERMLLGFIGPNPPSADLRAHLLGQAAN